MAIVPPIYIKNCFSPIFLLDYIEMFFQFLSESLNLFNGLNLFWFYSDVSSTHGRFKTGDKMLGVGKTYKLIKDFIQVANAFAFIIGKV